MIEVGRVCQAAAASLLILGLGACAVIDRVDPRYDTINRAAANARNESILLNIVRASHNVPLNFVAFSRVSGAHNLQGSAGLPAFGVGPSPLVAAVQRQAVLGSSVLNANTGVNNSFDIGILESKDFYNGLLSPVDLATVNFFIRQGYPRQLLFWLFTESVRETIGGRTFEYRNHPNPDISCDRDFPGRGRPRCFSDMIDVALASGLTAQTETVSTLSSGRVHSQVFGRMCFDEVLARQAKNEYSKDIITPLSVHSGHRPRCGDPWTRRPPAIGEAKSKSDDGTRTIGNPDTLSFEVLGTPHGRVGYAITTRSTFGIYRFLGTILRGGDAAAIMMRGRLGLGEEPWIPLLEIALDRQQDCLVDLQFDEHFYCVPRRGAETTKLIFSLLAQLLALRTQPGDLAITPAVRVSQ